MPFPTGLDPWEIVAFSGLCAIGILSIAMLIGVTVSYIVMREPRVAMQSAKRPVPTVSSADQPEQVPTTQPAFAARTSAAVAP